MMQEVFNLEQGPAEARIRRFLDAVAVDRHAP
jgi:hypothetical protein